MVTPATGSQAVKRSAQASSKSEAARRKPEVLRTMKSLRHPTGQGDAVELLGSHAAEGHTSNVSRIDELIRARRRGYLRKIGIVAGALAAVAMGVWVVFFSALFALNPAHITVEGGDERLSNDHAQSMLAAHANVPITRLNMSTLAEELSAAPAVKSAEVTREWPTGLKAVLTMRVPVMAEATDNGYALIDAEGVTLGNAPEKPEGLPTAVLPSDPALRTQAAEDLAYVSSILPEGLRSNVTEWTYDTFRISILFVDGRRAIWGTRDDSELKAKNLSLLVEQRYAKVYDVSSPTKPTTSDL